MMGSLWNAHARDALRHARAYRLVIAAATLTVVAALLHHGHQCAGDGCLACLGIHAAQALLAAACGIAVALPVLALPLFARQAHAFPIPSGTTHAVAVDGPILVAATPVRRKVILLI